MIIIMDFMLFYVFFFFLGIYDDSLMLLVSDFELIDVYDCKSLSNESKGFSSERRWVVDGLSWYFRDWIKCYFCDVEAVYVAFVYYV